MDQRLNELIGGLRLLARRSNDANVQLLAEKLINEYLRHGVGALTSSLERVRKAIDAECDKDFIGEDWRVMQDYVGWCLKRLAN
jgi:hypothetical protein